MQGCRRVKERSKLLPTENPVSPRGNQLVRGANGAAEVGIILKNRRGEGGGVTLKHGYFLSLYVLSTACVSD